MEAVVDPAWYAAEAERVRKAGEDLGQAAFFVPDLFSELLH